MGQVIGMFFFNTNKLLLAEANFFSICGLTLEKVLKIVKCADAVITDVYRRGSFIKNARKPRPLIVQFHNAITAKRVKASSGLLKDSSFEATAPKKKEKKRKHCLKHATFSLKRASGKT